MPADINIRPEIALGVKSYDPMTNISNMLGVANAAQEYQKARELLPYAIEAGKAQSSTAQTQAQQQALALKKAQELYQPEVQRSQAETRTAQAGAGSAELKLTGEKAQIGRNIAGALATDKVIREGKDPVAIMGLLSQAQQDMINNGLSPSEALAAIAPFAHAAHQNPQAIAPALENVVRQAAGPATQASLQTPQLVQGTNGPALYTSGTGQLSQPNIQGMQQQQPVQQPQGGNQLPYPVRKAGDLRPYAPTEAADEKAGQIYRQGLVQRQRDLTSAERNANEVISTATKLEKEAFFDKGGIAGNMERKLRMWASSEEYDQLAKDLANQTLSNSKALGGGDSVAGLNMNEVANGTIKVPPSVLIQIANRAKADMQNIDLQAKAANKFQQKNGDNNMAAFNQMWRDNSDSLLFQAMAINKSKIPEKEKKDQINKLFKDMSPEDIASFKTKKQNIDRMVNGDFSGIQ